MRTLTGVPTRILTRLCHSLHPDTLGMIWTTCLTASGGVLLLLGAVLVLAVGR